MQKATVNKRKLTLPRVSSPRQLRSMSIICDELHSESKLPTCIGKRCTTSLRH
jgi:hypothetical protein